MVRSFAVLIMFFGLGLRTVFGSTAMVLSMGMDCGHRFAGMSRVFHGGVVRIDRREIRVLTVA